MEKGTVSICFVDAALQAVRARGLDAEALLRQVGISPALLPMRQARVSAQSYGALWRLVIRVLDDEFFGQDSRRMKSGSFAMLCHAIIQCETLGKALERALRGYGLFLDDISGKLTQHGKIATLSLHERTGSDAHRRFAHETLLMMLHGVACWLVGRRIPILRAGFVYAEPAHSAEYRIMFSTHLSFAQPYTSITLDAGYLQLPVLQHEKSLKEFLRLAPENILVKYKNANSVAARIRRRLRQELPGELPDFAAIAAELNMTQVTLRRRLHEEGESYQSLKDQLRRDLAITQLSHSERSVIDIALELGFAERSAFHRAFRKWTGASPGEFRRSLQA